MSTPKRGDARDTIVKQNCHLFRQIFEAPKAVRFLSSKTAWISFLNLHVASQPKLDMK